MSLIDAFKTRCTLLVRESVVDGEGGRNTSWSDGASFDAAIVMDTTIDARLAAKDGMRAVYTVTVDKDMSLDYHDVFRRESDGQIFRVTSDCTDKMTPSVATFQFAQVNAEEWGLE